MLVLEAVQQPCRITLVLTRPNRAARNLAGQSLEIRQACRRIQRSSGTDEQRQPPLSVRFDERLRKIDVTKPNAATLAVESDNGPWDRRPYQPYDRADSAFAVEFAADRVELVPTTWWISCRNQLNRRLSAPERGLAALEAETRSGSWPASKTKRSPNS